MEYGWKEVSKIYYVINENQILGTERGLKHLEIEYINNSGWALNFVSAFTDCILEEVLFSRRFDIYEEKYIRDIKDGSYKTLWYKYSSSLIDHLNAQVSSDGEPAEFFKSIKSDTRELLSQKPDFI